MGTNNKMPSTIIFDPKTGNPIMTEGAKKNMDNYVNNFNSKANPDNIQQLQIQPRAPEWLVFKHDIINTYRITNIVRCDDCKIQIHFSDGKNKIIEASVETWNYLKHVFTYGVEYAQNKQIEESEKNGN